MSFLGQSSQHQGLTEDTCTTDSNTAAMQRANPSSALKPSPKLIPCTPQLRQNNGHGKKTKWKSIQNSTTW